MAIKVELSKLEKMEVREVWEHEARDFSQWLSEEKNLQALGDVLGLELNLIETEADVGNFRVDLVCKESTSEDMIVIENQLEQTDHDHLGKIITYAAGKNAKTIVWIVAQAREEHAKAIEWLNENLNDIDLYLIEIEVLKIGDAYAPNFKIIERPNTWGKAVNPNRGISPREELFQNFWMHFNQVASEHQDFKAAGLHTTKAWTNSHYNLRVGKSWVHLILGAGQTNKEISAGIYFKSGEEIFARIEEAAEELKARYGFDLSFNIGKKHRTIRTRATFDINDKKVWDKATSWMCDTAVKMKEILESNEWKKEADDLSNG